MAEFDCLKCKGHSRYVGGIMDGQVSHTIFVSPSDFPQTFGTLLRNGTRSWYEIDYDASEGSEVVYRCIGHGRNFPQSPATQSERTEGDDER